MAAAVVCLQAQRVTGLAGSVHQVDLGCHLRHPHLDADPEPEGRASASVSSEGVADFHNQVLLLHCALASFGVVTVSLSLLSDDSPRPRRRHRQQQYYLEVDLGAEQRQGVLSFPIAGAVLTLAIHRKLLPLPAATTPCLPLPACCRRRSHHQHRHGYDSEDESSDGFIVIEKQYRRPPSDNLPTSDGDEDTMKLELDRVEDEFLAMLELAETADGRIDLDMLVRDAEAELLARSTHLLNAAAATM
uniref:Uncharacterized protein n=1 Tax=Avena sativa TaxID=4498 RepID=A0ACD5WSB8_AVESA